MRGWAGGAPGHQGTGTRPPAPCRGMGQVEGPSGAGAAVVSSGSVQPDVACMHACGLSSESSEHEGKPGMHKTGRRGACTGHPRTHAQTGHHRASPAPEHLVVRAVLKCDVDAQHKLPGVARDVLGGGARGRVAAQRLTVVRARRLVEPHIVHLRWRSGCRCKGSARAGAGW